MPLHSAQAMVLFSEVIQEQDKRVILLTSSGTLIKAIAPGAARGRNRFGSVLELFSEGEFFFYRKEEKEMVTLTRGELKKTRLHLVTTASTIFYFHLLAEVIQFFLPEQHYDERLYKMTQAVLEAAEAGTGWAELLPYFLAWVLRVEGLLFSTRNCSNCAAELTDRGWVRIDFRGLLCGQCRQDESMEIQSDQLRFLVWTRNHHPRELFSWASSSSRSHLTRLLIRKMEVHGDRTLKCSLFLPEFQ